MPKAPKVLIVHANGSNRDHDAAAAIQLAGGLPEIHHVNELISNPAKVAAFDMLVVPGGFSYGDDLGSGLLWSLDLQERMNNGLQQFVDSGKPVIGICNGFQTLAKAGLFDIAERDVTLYHNQQEHFICHWVELQINSNCDNVFTRGIEKIDCPVAHGEGRVMVKDAATLDALNARNLIAIRYRVTPNGSVSDIAGLSNAKGNVLGLMPHPENHIFNWQFPRHHRGETGYSGLTLFKNGVAAC